MHAFGTQIFAIAYAAARFGWYSWPTCYCLPQTAIHYSRY